MIAADSSPLNLASSCTQSGSVSISKSLTTKLHALEYLHRYTDTGQVVVLIAATYRLQQPLSGLNPQQLSLKSFFYFLVKNYPEKKVSYIFSKNDLLIFRERGLSYISLKSFSYILGNGTFYSQA